MLLLHYLSRPWIIRGDGLFPPPVRRGRQKARELRMLLSREQLPRFLFARPPPFSPLVSNDREFNNAHFSMQPSESLRKSILDTNCSILRALE